MSKVSEEKQKEILNGKTTNLPLSENSLRLLTRGYLMTDFDGNIIESPEEMLERIAKTLSEVEYKYGKTREQVEQIKSEFLSIMTSLEYTPAGRTLANVGASGSVIANCIVLHMEDSMAGIFGTLKDATALQQQGSGLGFPFHLIRPAGEHAKRTGGKASGPVSFLRIYDYVFDVVKQKKRHGANMAVMSVEHPDVLEFINAKRVEGKIRNFNISVGLTDEFMRQVKEGSKTPWMCEYKGKRMLPRRIEVDSYGTVLNIKEVEITAAKIMDEIVDAAWNNGEPGIVFLDEVNRCNPLPGLGRIEACNPCGEQFLHDGDVCNLGSINLSQFVNDGEIDYERLKSVTKTSIRLMDNVIDIFDFAVPRVQEMSQGNRRIGLGVIGFADMLYKLKIPYNSEKGFSTARSVMSVITKSSHEMSSYLAAEKGTFPNYEHSIYARQGIKMRNAATTTVAPTGKISMFHDVASGIEPFFSLAYFTKTIVGKNDEFTYINKYLEKELKDRNLYSKELMEKIIENGGSLRGLSDIPEDMQKVYVTAMDIDASDHIKMQAAFQSQIDNSISKTINFASNARRSEIRKGYLLAWEQKCKGCTVYRDRSRDLQILNRLSDKKKKVGGDADMALVDSSMKTRPKVLTGVTHRVKTPQGTAFITVNENGQGDPFEVFVNIGRAGSDIAALSAAIGRLISGWLRSGVDSKSTVSEIVDQLEGLGGSKSLGFGKERILSLPDAIAKVLGKGSDSKTSIHVNQSKKYEDGKKISNSSGLQVVDICPECGNSSFIREEGCKKCYSCSYSEC